jgi:hypothetical protein
MEDAGPVCMKSAQMDHLVFLSTVAERVAWRRESTPTAAAVILDPMLAIQKDDLVKEMTGAGDDAEHLVRSASREPEGEWTGFRLDVGATRRARLRTHSRR